MLTRDNKKLSCRREAARCFVFVCSQLQHTYSAVFLLLVSAASNLLVHKFLLNSVLLSPIVSGDVRPKFPRQTPLGHNPPCFLPFVDRLGAGPRLVGRIGSGVWDSVSFQQKYPPGSVLRCPTAAENGVMTKGVVSGGFDPRLRRKRRARHKHFIVVLWEQRMMDAALSARLDAVRRGYIFHTSRLVRFTTL